MHFRASNKQKGRDPHHNERIESMDNGESSYRRYLDGDDNAFVEIIDTYKAGLTLYLCTFTGDVIRAEELMEDTFAKLFIKKPRFSGKSSFKTWLYAIARNLAVDAHRRGAMISDTPIEDTELRTDEEESVERMYIKEERKLMLHRALGKLKPDYRQVLYLVYFEDMDYIGAAAVMKKSRTQVKNLIARAKSSLRTELLKEGFVYEDN